MFTSTLYNKLKVIPGGSDSKESACSAGDPGSRRSPGEGMATLSSILAWRIRWTEEAGGLQFIGTQKVGHNLAIKHTHTLRKEEWEKLLMELGAPSLSSQKAFRATSQVWMSEFKLESWICITMSHGFEWSKMPLLNCWDLSNISKMMTLKSVRNLIFQR